MAKKHRTRITSHAFCGPAHSSMLSFSGGQMQLQKDRLMMWILPCSNGLSLWSAGISVSGLILSPTPCASAFQHFLCSGAAQHAFVGGLCHKAWSQRNPWTRILVIKIPHSLELSCLDFYRAKKDHRQPHRSHPKLSNLHRHGARELLPRPSAAPVLQGARSR